MRSSVKWCWCFMWNGMPFLLCSGGGEEGGFYCHTWKFWLLQLDVWSRIKWDYHSEFVSRTFIKKGFSKKKKKHNPISFSTIFYGPFFFSFSHADYRSSGWGIITNNCLNGEHCYNRALKIFLRMLRVE